MLQLHPVEEGVQLLPSGTQPRHASASNYVLKTKQRSPTGNTGGYFATQPSLSIERWNGRVPYTTLWAQCAIPELWVPWRSRQRSSPCAYLEWP